MNKLFILLFLLFIGIESSSQESTQEPQLVNIDWKVGSLKTIMQFDSTIIHVDDSLFMSTGAKSEFKIKIASLKDTVYEVLFQQILIDENISIGSEMMDATPMQRMMQELIIEIQKAISGLEYTFLVDKNTAMAFKVKNEEELTEIVEEMVIVVLNKFMDHSKVEIDDNQQKEIHLTVKRYLDEQMPAAIQTMLNAFNYIFQGYSFPYILDETYTQDIQVYNVDQVQHGDKENSAMLKVKSSKNGSDLFINYEYFYDKEEVYQTYVVSQGKEADIPMSEFDLEERVECIFDLKSSWIKSFTSFANVNMASMLINKKTTVIIQ
ncbi:MAG: hypothetical protein AAF487_07275 [Bacteroidota bacterium]